MGVTQSTARRNAPPSTTCTIYLADISITIRFPADTHDALRDDAQLFVSVVVGEHEILKSGFFVGTAAASWKLNEAITLSLDVPTYVLTLSEALPDGTSVKLGSLTLHRDELREKGLSRNNGFIQAFPMFDEESLCEMSASCITFSSSRLAVSAQDILQDLARRDPDVAYAIVLAQPDPSARIAILPTLVATFAERSIASRGEQDSRRTIMATYDFITVAPIDHPRRESIQSSLPLLLIWHMRLFPTASDVDNYVDMLQESLLLFADDDPDKAKYLDVFGVWTLTRFDRLGHLADIDQAISLLGDAVRLTPDANEAKTSYLSNLGNAHNSRFEHLGLFPDVDMAISLRQDAIRLTPDGRIDKFVYLNNLGNSYLSRYEHLGVLTDIDMAILMQKDALQLCPDGHIKKPNTLMSLGNSCQRRFERLGVLADIDMAISIQQDAVRLTLDGDTEKPKRLNVLGRSYQSRFKRLRMHADIDMAISCEQASVRLTPDGHANKPMFMNNLGSAYVNRFEHYRNLDDLEQAILVMETAAQLTPEGHAAKPLHLNNLGSSLMMLRHQGSSSDMLRAISVLEDAVRLMPDGHADKTTLFSNLAVALLYHWSHGDGDDVTELQSAVNHFSSAAHAIGHPSYRFKAAADWASCASILHHPSQLEAHSFTLDLLPQAAWLGMQIDGRYRELVDAGKVVTEAVATAIEFKRHDLAVEWLEQGRSVVWGQLLQLRTPMDDLSAAHPDIAEQLMGLSQALEHGSSATLPAQTDFVDALASEKASQRYRRLAEEWEELVQQVRRLAGFETFLMPKSTQQLSASIRCGPVILLNASRDRCDALIVRPFTDHVLHVPLPDCSVDQVLKIRSSLDELLFREGRIPLERASAQASSANHDYNARFEALLSWLWSRVVNPIIQALEFELTTSPAAEELPRLWWCPTGPFAFLPIHAAGDYTDSRPGSKLSDFAVSSYTPTVSALAGAPHTRPLPPYLLLTVAQSAAAGASHIPGTVEEINRIAKRTEHMAVLSLTESDATVETVTKAMQNASWAHFACHGIQNASNPMDSGLILAGGFRLSLSEIIKLSLPNAEFAFLSACQTAKGDKQLSEEAVHLAAGMLLAGYRGVIATMWSIDDNAAPQVADDFYSHLLMYEGGHPDSTQAARALHHAVQLLRGRLGPRKGYATWVPYVHIGI